jgi:hypothetical protein
MRFPPDNCARGHAAEQLVRYLLPYDAKSRDYIFSQARGTAGDSRMNLRRSAGELKRLSEYLQRWTAFIVERPDYCVDHPNEFNCEHSAELF